MLRFLFLLIIFWKYSSEICFLLISLRLALNETIILNELKLTDDQWIDFCILCGSDYTNRIYGIESPNAYKYIKKSNNIEKVLEHLENESIEIPVNYDYQKARKLFKHCEH